MSEKSLLTFAGYAVDRDNEQLRLDNRPVRLTNKAFAVLCYLVEHSGQLVTKDALFAAIWPETVVSETTLTNCIGEVRRALGDDPKQPRFIETVQRRGYRFLPAVTAQPVPSNQFSVVSQNKKAKTASQLITDNWQLTTVLVGREDELTQLHSLFTKALNGERQVVFVTGEAGIGKTALVDAFLSEVRGQETSQKAKVGARGWGLGASPSSQAPSPKSQVPSFPPQHSGLSTQDLPSSTPSTQHLAPAFIAHGQCIEQYGAGEAYLPVLEALERLGRQHEGARLISTLEQYAPTWLVQLPALLSPEELETVQRRIQGATRERMLREITEAFDILTAEHLLVVVLEDLHWSDPSTVELLAMLARRREPARLFIVGTYRAAELAVSNHPLKTVKQELVARGNASDVALSFLSPAAVREYVSQRLADHETTDTLADVVYQRTDGQPLFMVQVTDYVAHQLNTSVFTAADAHALLIPQGVRELIEAQLGRLTEDEQNVLAVSSVVGAEFTAASVAAGMAVAEAKVEAVCERLARRGQFIEERGVRTWPDDTVSARYGFRHALYHEVLYARIPEARRVRWHQAIGERIEAGYGERANEIAAELAAHFERGRDYQRAVQYHQQAGEKALQRRAYREAIEHVEKGLALFQRLPASREHVYLELLLHITHGAALLATKGFGAPDVEQTYTRARVLSQRLEDTPTLVPVLCGLWNFYLTRAEFPQVRDLADQLLTLAQRQPDPVFLLQAHNVRGQTSMFMGEPAAAQMHIEQNLALYEVQTHGTLAAIYGEDPGVVCHMYAALTRWLLGYPDQAVRHLAQGLHLAQTLGHPFGVAQMLWMDGVVSQSRGDSTRVHEQTQTLISLCQKEDFPVWLVEGRIVQGWALAVLRQWEYGISQIRQGLDDCRAMEMGLILPYNLALLAEAYGEGGREEEGLHMLTEALEVVHRTGERWYEAELWRLRGELTLAQSRVQSLESGVREKQKAKKVVSHQFSVVSSQHPAPNTQGEVAQEAEGCFLKAIEVARRQQAKSLELRAVMSLVRLRQQQAMRHESRNTHHVTRVKLTEAHQLLAEVYGWFTEGFDTQDLQEAKALLDSMRH